MERKEVVERWRMMLDGREILWRYEKQVEEWGDESEEKRWCIDS